MADPLEQITHYLQRVADNFRQTFQNVTLEKWIRLVVIVGAYVLLRPYLI